MERRAAGNAAGNFLAHYSADPRDLGMILVARCLKETRFTDTDFQSNLPRSRQSNRDSAWVTGRVVDT